MRTRSLSICLALVLAVAAMLVTACSESGGPLPHPAVTAVSEVLELRRDDVRDVDAYTPYFEDAQLAEALAAPSAEPTGTPRVPPYGPPYLSAESTSTADVAVVWEADAAFAGWSPATIFRARLSDGAWRIIDAVETTTVPEPLLPEAD